MPVQACDVSKSSLFPDASDSPASPPPALASPAPRDSAADTPAPRFRSPHALACAGTTPRTSGAQVEKLPETWEPRIAKPAPLEMKLPNTVASEDASRAQAPSCVRPRWALQKRFESVWSLCAHGLSIRRRNSVLTVKCAVLSRWACKNKRRRKSPCMRVDVLVIAGKRLMF